MKISNQFQANTQTLKIASNPSKTSSTQEESKVKKEEEIRFQNALVAKIKELNQKVSSLQSYDKTLSLIQEEIAELQAIKTQISEDSSNSNLTLRLDTLKTRLKPMLEKLNHPLLTSSKAPSFDQVLKNPQKYEELAISNQEKTQKLLKEYEDEIENMFEENITLDEKMLSNPAFKNAHNLAKLASDSLLLTQ